MKMKKIFAAVVSVAMLATSAMPAFAKSFPDTTGHWAENAVSVWSDNGIVNGDDQGNFRPDDSITRAETATILDNMIGYTKQSVKVFSDVSKSDWFAYSISRLYQAGVITGYEDGTIAPNNSISRQEAVVMMSRAFGFETDDADTAVLDSFSDKDLIGDWSADAIAFMAERGYVQGNDGQFRPTAQITRAEIVTIVNNIVGIYANGTQSTYSGDFGHKITVIKDNVTFNGVVLGGAVVSPAFTGRVNFNNNSKINGHLMDLSTDSTVSVAGAKVASQTAPNKKNTTTPSYNTGGSYSGGGYGGSGGGGGSSSSNKTTYYDIKFDANGGEFDDGDETYKTSARKNNSFKTCAPDDPTYDGYKFIGWYYKAYEPDEADSSQEVDMRGDLVTKDDTLYAGWEKIDPKYGAITAATEEEFEKAEDFMKDVKVSINKKDETEFTAEGTLNFVEYEYSAMVTSGNFIALTYTLPSTLKNPEDAVVTSYYDGMEKDTAESYSKFKDEELSFTRVFLIDDNTPKYIIFSVDFDGDEEDYEAEEISVDISELKLGKQTFTTVTTEGDFVAAIADEDITKITVNKDITLVAGTAYGLEDSKKTVVLNNKLTVPASTDSKTVISNLDFVTEGEDVTAIEISSGANVEIKNNSFDGFATAILIKGEGTNVLADNVFLDNTLNIKSEAVNVIEDYSYNYFKDIEKIDADYPVLYPTYDEEDLSTISAETEDDDAYVVVKTAAETKIYSLSDEDFIESIALAAETDEVDITVVAKDTRDEIDITKGEEPLEGSTVTLKKDESITIKVGEGTPKTITVTYTAPTPTPDPEETPGQPVE